MEQENERNGTGESPSLSLQIFVQITTEIKFESFSELPVGSKLSPLPSTSNTIENCLGVQHKILSSDISLRLDLIRFNIINIKLDLILLKICPSSIDGMPTVSFTNFIISDKNISMTNLWATKLLCIYKRSDY